ncbi:hypothetical protein KC19_2G231900 [Ceratodon purpureus]|uniref:Uncharacterized protein n=1 Tax=Ceratodon purpureus TaxID=3225 RepID=A0A8T0IYJ0_CERPU|nr:hypothetical protein KC19_2G231900 [Ceratodon purpureus]
MTTFEFMKQRLEDASEHHLVKKAGNVLFHMVLAVLALIMTVMICGYIIYTISFIVPPYFHFMYIHGPYSFLVLLLLWAAALTRYLGLSSEDPLNMKWEILFYGFSTFLMFTGIGAFVVLPFVNHTP